jgi:hypothetical protein
MCEFRCTGVGVPEPGSIHVMRFFANLPLWFSSKRTSFDASWFVTYTRPIAGLTATLKSVVPTPDQAPTTERDAVAMRITSWSRSVYPTNAFHDRPISSRHAVPS